MYDYNRDNIQKILRNIESEVKEMVNSRFVGYLYNGRMPHGRVALENPNEVARFVCNEANEKYKRIVTDGPMGIKVLEIEPYGSIDAEHMEAYFGDGIKVRDKSVITATILEEKGKELFEREKNTSSYEYLFEDEEEKEEEESIEYIS